MTKHNNYAGSEIIVVYQVEQGVRIYTEKLCESYLGPTVLYSSDVKVYTDLNSDSLLVEINYISHLSLSQLSDFISLLSRYDDDCVAVTFYFDGTFVIVDKNSKYTLHQLKESFKSHYDLRKNEAIAKDQSTASTGVDLHDC